MDAAYEAISAHEVILLALDTEAEEDRDTCPRCGEELNADKLTQTIEEELEATIER